MNSRQSWPPAPATPAGPAAEPADAPGRDSRTSVFEALADSQRRAVLDVLLERSRPVHEHDLAAEIATETESSADEDAVATARRALRHVHLPALESVPLIDWDRDASLVEAVDHPALEDDTVRRVVGSDAPLDDLLEALADDRRRLVLAVLYTYGGPVDVETVAEKLAQLESGDADESAPRELRISLRHVHLAKLEDAELVRRDTERNTVQYVGHPDVEEDWFTF